MDEQNKSVNERWVSGETHPNAEADLQVRRGSSDRGRMAERGYAAEEEPDRGDRRTSEIRAEIHQTRAEMTDTIDEIQDRLRPGNIVSRAAGTVREATVDKFRQMTGRDENYDRTPRRAADWYYGNGIIARVRENPIPAAIAGVSLAWLAFGRRASRDYDGPPYRRSGAAGPFYATDASAATAGVSTGDDQSNRGAIGETAEQAMARARGAAAEAGVRVRRSASTAQYRMRRLAHENTMAAGALALAIGAAVGLMLPETERENELMGDARDSMVDRAKDAARSAAERVQDTAQQIQKVAADAISATDSKPEGTPGTAS